MALGEPAQGPVVFGWMEAAVIVDDDAAVVEIRAGDLVLTHLRDLVDGDPGVTGEQFAVPAQPVVMPRHMGAEEAAEHRQIGIEALVLDQRLRCS